MSAEIIALTAVQMRITPLVSEVTYSSRIIPEEEAQKTAKAVFGGKGATNVNLIYPKGESVSFMLWQVEWNHLKAEQRPPLEGNFSKN